MESARIKKKRVRSNNRQISMLVDYMLAHPRLANNKFNGPQGKAQKDAQWEGLRTTLNKYGPDKSVEQWEHTWRDLRLNARKIRTKARTAQRATGDTVDVPVLSPLILKVLRTIGQERAVGVSEAEKTSIGSMNASTSRTTGSRPLSRATVREPRETVSEPLPEVIGSEHLSRAIEREPLSRATESEVLLVVTGSELLARAIERDPLSTATKCEVLPLVNESQILPSAIERDPLSTATKSEVLPVVTESELFPRTIKKEPLSSATENDPLPRATGRRRSRTLSAPSSGAQRSHQGLGRRAADFLQPELASNTILMDISRHLEIISSQINTSNNYNFMRSRLAFRESMWRLRRQRFNF